MGLGLVGAGRILKNSELKVTWKILFLKLVIKKAGKFVLLKNSGNI